MDRLMDLADGFQDIFGNETVLSLGRLHHAVRQPNCQWDIQPSALDG